MKFNLYYDVMNGYSDNFREPIELKEDDSTEDDPYTIYEDYPNENGAFLRNHGCGLIAYTDFRLYIENSNHSFDAETYASEIEASLDDVEVTGLGVPFKDICSAIEDIGSESFTASYDNILSQDGLIQRIESMLRNDIPVIASYSSLNTSGESIDEYTLNYNGESYFVDRIIGSFSGHWFVVTGIIYDNISNEPLLRIANGSGQQTYIQLNDYCEHMESNAWLSSIMTGVINVR